MAYQRPPSEMTLQAAFLKTLRCSAATTHR